MPKLELRDTSLDYATAGAGDPVVLIHGSASSNRQWRRLIEDLGDRYQVLAINLFGYGETSPWPARTALTLADQADLVEALCETVSRPVRLVGHCFGGSVALKTAERLGDRLAGLVLLEPNPFHLLAAHGRTDAYGEICALRDVVQRHGRIGDWHGVAQRFADYANGEGTWSGMSPARQQVFVKLLRPTLHEWDALMNENVPLDRWRDLPVPTLLAHAADTQAPILELIQLFHNACPHWAAAELPEGGHMAPLSRPDLVNPVVADFLDRLS